MIAIVGGTYREINLDTCNTNIFGSGLRGTTLFLENTKEEICFYTAGNSIVSNYLELYKENYSNLNCQMASTSNILSFKYDYALDAPNIIPDPRTLDPRPTLKVDASNVVCYGMLDCLFNIKGDKVVYDPQTSINPIRYRDNNDATELIYIVNDSEAKSIADCEHMNDIIDFFFDVEQVKALIIKSGPNGSKLFINKKEIFEIPAYKTDNVYKIGSGDIFTSAFAYFWFHGIELIDCALRASQVTALYCDKETYSFLNVSFDKFSLKEYKFKDISNKQIYLAAPIFSLSHVMLIDRLRESFLQLGVKVFSPFHDVGYGDDKHIADLDIKGLDDSDIVFAVLDGLDSGTLIELGNAMAKSKKIIGYHRTENEGSLLMLEAADIKYFNHLTTAIYHTIWEL